MAGSAFVQTITLVVALAALGISLWQSNAVARQSREATRQSATATAALRESAVREYVRRGADFTYEALSDDPQLLSWFLTTRGLQSDSEFENRKRLFLWVRLDMHQANFDAHRDGHLSEELWSEWLPTFRADLATTEFRPIWDAGRALYTPDFADLVDRELAQMPPGTGVAAAGCRRGRPRLAELSGAWRRSGPVRGPGGSPP